MAEDTRTNEQIIEGALFDHDFTISPEAAVQVHAALAAAGRLVDNTPTGNAAALILDLRTWAGARPYLYGDEHRALLRQVADALEASEAARANLEARMPCDGGCNYNDGPDETCSRDGRPVAEVWGIANDATARANQAEGDVEVLRDRVALLEATIAHATRISEAYQWGGLRWALWNVTDGPLARAGDPVVLREHDAKVWDEGFVACDEWNGAPLDEGGEPVPVNPYRKGEES